ncbi:MAG: hypothetical protein RI894_1877 [Bacteroidota bacterium]
MQKRIFMKKYCSKSTNFSMETHFSMQKYFVAILAIAASSFSALNAQTTPLPTVHDGCINQNGILVRPDGTPCVNTIVTALPFLRIVSDARSGAMGDAGLAIAPDANSMHFNPSKLVFAEKDMGISATYTPWLRALGLQDVYLAYLSGYKAIDKRQAVGMSVRYFSLGEIQYTDDAGASLGSDRPNEFELALAYSRKLSPNFSGGLTMKYLYSRLASGQSVNGNIITAYNGVAADLSCTYKKVLTLNDRKANLMIAGAIHNVGPKVSYTNAGDEQSKDFIPTNLGVGGALDMQIDDFNSFTVTADVNKLLVPTPTTTDADKNRIPDYKAQNFVGGMISSFGDAPNGFQEEMTEIMYSIGAEYWYDKQFAVRAGYYYEDQNKGNRKFLTVGLGLRYNVFGLNFSYLVPTTQQRNPLDNTLRFSLLFDFGALNDDDAGKKKTK